MENTTTSTGELGEELAAQFLAQKGYAILARRWRLGKNEVDIIARNGQTLVFVEVKLRKSAQTAAPWQAVNRAKQQAIIRCADAYLRWHTDGKSEARFDVISVTGQPGAYHIEHIERAFYPIA
ncbi:MAG: hypothetical protein RL226_2366 [Bacteroidota bacterium]|jgi:putative endonuclease